MIAEWVRERHPDWLLIVNSDHGGQQYIGEDDALNHGRSDQEENKPFLLLYSALFAALPARWYDSNLNYLDIAPTIAGYMRNVNVPFNTQGFPK